MGVEHELDAGEADDPTVALTAELVRIPSVNPPGEGEKAVAEVLRDRLDRAGLDTRIVTSPAGRPSLIAKVPGPTDRPPLVLLSHTDVVPVEEDDWRHDPFGGEVIGGELWGRGTLDMKGVAALHVLAAVALARSGKPPTRELLVVAVADEEDGGAEGAEWLVRDHADLVGFGPAGPPEVLGEGGFVLSGILDRPIAPVVVAEKSPLGVRARAIGDPGHGSLPPRRQAIRGLARFVDEVAGPRPARLHPVVREHLAGLAAAANGAEQRVLSALAGPSGPVLVRTLAGLLRRKAGVVANMLYDTITPTQLDAGYKINVVPGRAEARFDARLLPDTDPDELLAWLRSVGRRHGVVVDELHRWNSAVSPRGELFDAAAASSEALPGAPVAVPALTPGMTDLRFFRARGATAYGWVPVTLSSELRATFHGHDERVPVAALRDGQRAMDEVVLRRCS